MSFKKIVEVLRQTGKVKCIEKVEELELNSSLNKLLNLRSLGLSVSDVRGICSILKEGNDHLKIKSISFSYNPLIGDEGAVLIAQSLPFSIGEIGMVGCGIGDIGGRELLKLVKNTSNLSMICIENNNFSDALKAEFKAFQKRNPTALFVF
ncbi:MAG: hypothetical protein P1U56_08180 [Saprospiraceae bacterium]|nr:hypothetical protein [Saprospiraceae bacterium]